MTAFRELFGVFEEEAKIFKTSWAANQLRRGLLAKRHYMSLMRQLFHHTRENPQLQALSTVYFRGTQREVINQFFRHAASEVGHDQLALNDFAACGGDPTDIPKENPLPATSGLLASAFYQVQHRNPVAYLGYLYFLEFLPTVEGEGFIRLFKAAGVPEHAFTFLEDHVRVDIAHNRAMERYCDALLRTAEDLDAAIYSLRTTAYLYRGMVDAAIEAADSKIDYGVSHQEAMQPGRRLSSHDVSRQPTSAQPDASP